MLVYMTKISKFVANIEQILKIYEIPDRVRGWAQRHRIKH